jgi:plasmid maintenance system antidote protein VapI
MAELLNENSDEWTALAGRVPDDLAQIIQEAPTEISELLRAVRGMTAEQLRKLRQAAERMKERG